MKYEFCEVNGEKTVLLYFYLHADDSSSWCFVAVEKLRDIHCDAWKRPKKEEAK